MKNTRVNEIMESLKNLGTNANELYTNKEIVDNLKELQIALAKGVFEKTHAENLRDRDVLIHFEALAAEYDLDKTETFKRFKDNMTELSYTIGSFIKGMNGERIAKKALKLLTYENGTKVLYNVELEDEDAQAEYDAIVIAPYGLFVVEVKNWNASMVIETSGLLTRNDTSGIVYDLAGRMSIKEALLRKYIGNAFPEAYYGMLLISNEYAQIEDRYHQIPVCRGNGLSYMIKAYNTGEQYLTEDQINSIEEAILSNHKEQRALCTVKCEEIIADYATLMAEIEYASADRDSTETEKETAIHNKKSWFKNVNWKKIGHTAACVAATVLPGVVMATLLFNREG